MQAFGLSNIGKKRETNEDNFGIAGFLGDKHGGIAVVADGMGGHKAGEVASSESVNLICDELSPLLTKDVSPQNIKVALVAAIKNANSTVRNLATAASERAGMGTTIVVAYTADNTVYVANVGDSRAYILNSEILQISRDHSLVEELISDGTITRAEAKKHPRKHVITRAVGTDVDILADIFEYKYQPGDTLLLCSDGLTEMIDDSEILSIVNTGDDIKSAVINLVDKANEYGGLDNITVVGVKLC